MKLQMYEKDMNCFPDISKILSKRYYIIIREMSKLSEVIVSIIRNIPGRAGILLRNMIYSSKFSSYGRSNAFLTGTHVRGYYNISIGSNVNIGINNQIYCSDNPGGLVIGNNVFTNSNVMLNADCGGVIKIGNNVLIGPNVVIRSADHNFSSADKPILEQGHNGKEIIIEDDVWIGANAVVLKGVRISKGAVVGAGAVVTKDLDEYVVAGGVPAKKITSRN